jgi:hypothetical protein
LLTTTPPFGLCVTTWPAGTTGSNASVFVPIVSPAAASWLKASVSVRPRRSGTATVSALATRVSFTTPPWSIEAPAAGSWESTVFGAWPLAWAKAAGVTVRPD